MLNLASRARPYLGAVFLTTLLLTAGGIYSAFQMPSGVYPEVTFPRIAVVAKKPGLSVSNMEVQVTRPLEDAVSAVIGVARVRSKTIRGGCDLSITLAPGTDVRRAEQMAWNRIGAARSLMPPDVELTVEQMTPSVFPILSLVLTGGDGPAPLRDYAYYQLAPRIKNLPDVLFAEVAGGDVREIEVEARPDDLLAAGLSAADLADQIGRAHRLEPVGRVERPPFAFQVLVNSRGGNARDIGDLVMTGRNNQPLRVSDVADVKVAARDRVSSIGFEGRDAVVVTVFRRLGGNTVGVAESLRDLLKRQPLPGTIKATIVYDQSRFVQNAVANVRDAILLGGLFSVLILLAFLRSWRATLVAALALPTTLAITFLFLHWSGETLNLMSLGGLAVAIGLIIDDTVVVIENIARHLAPSASSASIAHPPLAPVPRGAGDESRPAATGTDPVDAASGEITGAVIGSTLTTVLVFVPLAFISGVYGQFFASLSWSLSIAVLVSMVISLTLVPVAAARFLAGRPMPEPGLIFRSVSFLYEKLLQVALYFPRLTLFGSVAAIAVGVVLYTGIPNPNVPKGEPGRQPAPPLLSGLRTGLMPQMDEGAFVLDYLAPSGTPLERTEEMARTLESLLNENPDVQAYVRRTGTQLGLFATEANRGDIQVVLRPAEDDPVSLWTKPVRPNFADIEDQMKEWGKEAAIRKYGPGFTENQVREEGKAEVRRRYRRRPLPKVMEELEDEAKEHFGEHQLKVELIQIMEDELNDLSGANKPIEVKLFGPDYGELRHKGEEVAEMLEKKGNGRGIKEVSSGVFEGNPDLMVQVDKVKAARLGLAVQEVERQLRAVYVGQLATQVRESSERITDVRVRYPDAVRFGRGGFSPDSVLEPRILLPDSGAASVTNSEGLSGLARAVPLSAVASIERVRTPEEQVRENLQPAVIVSTELDTEQAGLGSVVADVQNWMKDVKLPSGYRWELGGHYVNQRDAFRSLTMVMAVAILLVFIMLAFQFRSVLLPLLIFLTQPLSLVSGLFALWVTTTPLNVSSYMGAILLIGLDMKNGILLVEYIQQLRAGGMELRQSLLLAGRTRFRPILMTSLAAILGLFPLALGIGPGARMQQPLAIMVIGGLTANMLFTRVVIPAGYLLLERRKRPALASSASP
jgi:multidrug efflux pump subunit AcrB